MERFWYSFRLYKALGCTARKKETLLQYTFFNGAKFVMLREPAGAQGQEHRDAEAAGEVVAENAGQDDQRSGKQ